MLFKRSSHFAKQEQVQAGSHCLPSNGHCDCTRRHGWPLRHVRSCHRRAAWRQGRCRACWAQRGAGGTGHGKPFHGQNLGNLDGLETKLRSDLFFLEDFFGIESYVVLWEIVGYIQHFEPYTNESMKMYEGCNKAKWCSG